MSISTECLVAERGPETKPGTALRTTPADGSLILRLAKADDASDIARFYAPYVTNTAVNFEYKAPDAAEFASRIEVVQRKYPFIVAQRTGKHDDIVGYVFAAPMGDRPAWGWSVDTSIYLDADVRGHHLGTRLYAALEELLLVQGVVQVFSCITVARDDDLADVLDPAFLHAADHTAYLGTDPHLPSTSPRFHAARGYRVVGRELACGFKFGTWYDKLWMQKQLREPPADPAPVTPIGGLADGVVSEVLSRH